MNAPSSISLPATRPPERQARSLYWMGWNLTQIAEELDIPEPTVRSWKRRRKWDRASAREIWEDSLEARGCMLVLKDKKSGGDFKEIDLIGRQFERTARIRRYEQPDGHEGDLNPKVANRNAGPKKKPKKNYFTPEQIDTLEEAFHDECFEYQEKWWSKRNLRTRTILKARQTGATWYFAREALIKALRTGRNQIFLSASRRQAEIFRRYIVAFAQSKTGVKLDGDPIMIQREEGEEPVGLYFISTNSRTAQGEHGDFYFDEFFWVYNFKELKRVASAMATHKIYKRTYFSTPSSVTHEAYGFWSGKDWNEKRPKDKKGVFDLSHATLKDGAEGPDRMWRQMINIEDAITGGAHVLFDLDELREENDVDEFANLYMLDFIDDTQSQFPMAILQPALVDSFYAWRDFDQYAPRPFKNQEVWIGYDPQESADGDNAACVVVAPPEGPEGKFRILDKFQWRGLDYEEQDAELRALAAKYRVTEIAIDRKGVGSAVYQLVKKWFPRVKGIDYSLASKTEMVLKAKRDFRKRRIEFDMGWTDVLAAFMSIRAELTGSGRNITYVARRSAATGHADLAWAIMHALICEPIDASDGKKTNTRVEISG